MNTVLQRQLSENYKTASYYSSVLELSREIQSGATSIQKVSLQFPL
jgi:hypothetical protein